MYWGSSRKGDNMMADCSFNIDDLLTPKGATLNILPLLDSQSQLTRKDVDNTQESAKMHIT